MVWFGKSIGGLIGAFVAGPVGSLIGILVGHQWDQSAGSRRSSGGGSVSRLFFEATFEVMGQVAKADGRVSETEIAVARQIMHHMRLTEAQKQLAIRHFTDGKRADYPLSARLTELGRGIGRRADLGRAFLQIQFQSAIGAGDLGAAKREVLSRVAAALGVNQAELAQIEAIVRGVGRGQGARATAAEDLANAYRVLGIRADAGNDEVKKAYRRLMNQHHPDKLVARGLPESMIDIAEQKTHEVRTAYELIKTQRGFK